MAARRRTASRRPRPNLEFNHAMIYTRDLARALAFYADALGFQVVDSYPGAYARLTSPKGGTTIALHCLDGGQRMTTSSEGVRLYFEVRSLDAFCMSLQERGISFDQPPHDMPWGWRHAYLCDPDGHQLSLYWAGKARLKPTTMRGAER